MLSIFAHQPMRSEMSYCNAPTSLLHVTQPAAYRFVAEPVRDEYLFENKNGMLVYVIVTTRNASKARTLELYAHPDGLEFKNVVVDYLYDSREMIYAHTGLGSLLVVPHPLETTACLAAEKLRPLNYSHEYRLPAVA